MRLRVVQFGHNCDKQIRLPLRVRPSLICYHSYDYRTYWTPLSPITITYFTTRTAHAVCLTTGMKQRQTLARVNYVPFYFKI